MECPQQAHESGLGCQFMSPGSVLSQIESAPPLAGYRQTASIMCRPSGAHLPLGLASRLLCYLWLKLQVQASGHSLRLL